MEAWVYRSATAERAILGSGNWGGPTTYDWSWDINMHSATRTVRFDMYNAALERLKEAYWAQKERVDVARETDGKILEPPVWPEPEDAIREANIIMNFVNGDK
mgnify:CR=1 FL=1